MGRQPCCDKVGLKRDPWTIEEDHKLINFILNNGIHCWRMVPKLIGIYIYNYIYHAISLFLSDHSLSHTLHTYIYLHA